MDPAVAGKLPPWSTLIDPCPRRMRLSKSLLTLKPVHGDGAGSTGIIPEAGPAVSSRRRCDWVGRRVLDISRGEPGGHVYRAGVMAADASSKAADAAAARTAARAASSAADSATSTKSLGFEDSAASPAADSAIEAARAACGSLLVGTRREFRAQAEIPVPLFICADPERLCHVSAPLPNRRRQSRRT